MPQTMKVKIRRVLEGDEGVRAISVQAFVSDVIPADGFIVYADSPVSTPLYVRDEDIEAARQAREEKNRAIVVEAKSWKE